MEQEKSLIKQAEVKLPAFVENAYQTIEGMKEFANMLLESKLLPNHFYELGADKKPDYTKGKTASVVIVLIQAQQLGIPPMTALQHIIPVNGLLSIKGDLAKTMIFASGKLKRDSWKEEVSGTIENENMTVSITATRADNGMTLTRTFSVEKAKRAGLWITPAQVNGPDGYKYKASAWYKYPERMITYRALGFIARDLFADVLNNMYITEEAMDMPKDVTEIIDVPDGKIIIPDKQFNQERSGTLTERAAKKIKPTIFTPVEDPISETIASSSQDSQIEFEEAQYVQSDSHLKQSGDLEVKYTLEEMEQMDTKVLMDIIKKDADTIEAIQIVPGKNTNKKLREIIWAHQNGTLSEYLASFIKEEIKDNVEDEKDSEKEKEQEQAQEDDYDIPGFDKGNEREFSTMKNLFNKMASMGVDNFRWIEIATKLGIYPDKYKSREEFCRFASVEEIRNLLRNR